jgi:hypothetical protein
LLLTQRAVGMERSMELSSTRVDLFLRAKEEVEWLAASGSRLGV